MMAIVAAGLAVAGQNLVTAIVAVLLWFGCIGIFRQMANADPQMSRVYLRQVQYRGYYPARSRPYRGVTKSPCAFYIVTGLIVIGLLFWML